MFRMEEGRAGSHQSIVFASAALEVETREKQTNSCHLPRAFGRSPFHSQECDKEKSQPGVCLYPSSFQVALGLLRNGTRMGHQLPPLSPKKDNEPSGRAAPRDWERGTAHHRGVMHVLRNQADDLWRPVM